MRMLRIARFVGVVLLAGVETRGLWAADPGMPSSPGSERVPADAPAGAASPAAEDRSAAYESLHALAEALLHVRRNYVTEKSYRDLVHGALRGMLESLDPHSGFLEPKAFEGMQEDTRGVFSGIGIHIGVRDGLLTVIAPIEDTPAFRAGLLAGDRIVEIDGIRTQGMPLDKAVEKLRGPKGSRVSLTVVRAGAPEPLRIEIVRDVIEVPSVKGGRILRDGVGYVRITNFAETTGDALEKELDRLLGEGMTALVLDLRNNPGGLLKTAVEVAEKFLPENAVIVVTRGRRPGVDEMVSRAGGQRHFTNFPMSVLINQGSASASEIVAGALQDHRRGVLIGERTFGKGSVQTVIRLNSDAGSAIRLTTAYYYTPKGRRIHEQGLEPDILVELRPEEWQKILIRRSHLENPSLFPEEEKKKYEDVVDVSLQRAVDLLHAIRLFQSARR